MLKHSPIWIVLLMLVATVGISQAQTKQEVQDIPEEAVGWVGGVAYAVAVRDNYAYVGFGSDFTVVDVNNKTSPIIISTLPLPQIIEEVHLTEEIAFLLLDDLGFWLIDITNPLNPFVVNFYLEEGLAQTTIRYPYVYGIVDNYLKIWDVSDVQHIQLLSSTQPDYPDLDWISDLVVEGTIAYLMKRELPALTWAIDVSNPSIPIQISSWTAGAISIEFWGRSLFYYEERCFRVCMGGIAGWDLSDIYNPVYLGTDVQVILYDSLFSYKMKGEGIYLYVGTDAAVFAYLPAQPAENGQVVMAYPLAHVRDLAVSQGYLWVASEQGLIIFEDLPRQKAFLPVHLR